MKVIKKSQEKDLAKIAKKYKEDFNRDYQPSTAELTPLYHLIDDEGNPIVKHEKVYNEEKNGFDIVKTPVIYSQFQINSLKKMGQQIEILSEKELKEQKEAFAKLIAEAEKRGYEKALKEKK